MPLRNHTDSVSYHALRPLVTCKVPARVIAFGVASSSVGIGREVQHTLRGWSMIALDRGHNGADPTIHCSYTGVNSHEFAIALTEAVPVKGETYAYCTDISYSSTLLQVPQCLAPLGWKVTAFNITGDSVWFKLSKGNRRLIICDVSAVIPDPINKLAEYCDIPLAVKPDETETDISQWHSYCWNRAQIIVINIAMCMDYCEENELGSWALTGSGIGWNVYCKRFLTEKILISSDTEARQFERRAIRGGRREVFWTAEWENGYFADIDIRGAYPSIARSSMLPCKRGAKFTAATVEWHKNRPADQGIIARCTVKTSAPLVPATHGTTTFYATGEFTTILASPEIDFLVESGAEVKIHDGYRYLLAPIMQKWGQWVMEQINAPQPLVLPAVRRMIKHWSRTVIGRWSMRYMREDKEYVCDPSSLVVEKIGYMNYDPRDTYERDGLSYVRSGAQPTEDVDGYLINLDGKPRAFYKDAEPDNGFPAVTAFVESICRVMLVKLMAAQPCGTIMQCDTDGYLVRFTEREVLKMAGASFYSRPDVDALWLSGCTIPLPTPPDGYELAIKGRYTNVHIRGAQQLRLDGKRRMAGIPHNARELEPELLQAEVFPSYAEQLRHGKPGTYVAHEVTFASKSTIASGWRDKSGRVMPVNMHISHGVNVIEAPSWRYLTKHGMRLADHQHPILEAILGK